MTAACKDYTNFIAKAFCEGGPVMYIIAFIGLLVTFLIIERLIALNKLTVDKQSLNENLFSWRH